MKFTFTVSPLEEPPPSGFDMGDMRVEGGHGVASSVDGGSRHLMMIHLSVTHLLYGLARLVSGADREFRFVGTDGSFALRFTRRKDGQVVTRQDTRVIDESPARDVLRAAATEAQRFAEEWLPQLPDDDAGGEDLVRSLNEAKTVLESR
jgi:hypothetical protein